MGSPTINWSEALLLLVLHNLIGGIPTPLKNMKVNGKDDIPYIMENKKCLKPPTRLLLVLHNVYVPI